MSLREQVAAHEYLGTTEDVTAGGSSLVGGETLSLPVLVTNGAVIFPTQQLPLKLFGAEEKLAIDRALSHPLPSHRNLVFVLTRGNVPIERNRIEDRLPRGERWLLHSFPMLISTKKRRAVRRGAVLKSAVTGQQSHEFPDI